MRIRFDSARLFHECIDFCSKICFLYLLSHCIWDSALCVVRQAFVENMEGYATMCLSICQALEVRYHGYGMEVLSLGPWMEFVVYTRTCLGIMVVPECGGKKVIFFYEAGDSSCTVHTGTCRDYQ